MAAPADRDFFTREIVELNIAQDRLNEAEERLQPLLKAEAAEKRAPNPETTRLLFLLALKSLDKQQFGESKRWEEGLARREGPDGTLWRYCRAWRLVAAAKDQYDPQFVESDRLLGELQKMRPTWSQTFLLEAVILQKRDKLDDAVDAYQKAIQLGCGTRPVYERYVALLGRLGRFAEVDRCLAALKDQLAESAALSAMEISLAAERGQWRQAIEFARNTSETRARDSQTRDPQATISLALLLELDNQGDKAEETLQKALQAAPDNAALHFHLLACYVRNGKKQLAKDCLQQIKLNTALSDIDRMRLLAQGCELIQDAAGAEAAWKAVINLTKDTPQDQLALAEQLKNRDPDAAEKARARRFEDRRRLAARTPVVGLDLARARRRARMGRGDPPPFRKARRSPGGALYQQLQASVLASRGGKKNLEQARGIFEKLVADSQQVRAEDHINLAGVYEIEGKLDQAQAQLRARRKCRIRRPRT